MKLYLIDGYGFVFRAFHSLPPLSSPCGVPVSAVYGFTNMIAKIIEKHEFDSIAVALDSGSKNYRHEIFDQYKANRSEPDEDLKVQFPIIREAVKAMNLKVLEEKGFEADDLLATYAINAVGQGAKVTIIASDKDLMQLLVHKNIEIYDPIKNKLITNEDVRDKFGIYPDKLTDAMALMGDSSDNIPGVKGVGKKTAASLLEKFGSLENIYNSLDYISSKRVQELLKTNRENADLSKKLVTLNTDAPVKFALEELKFLKPDNDYLSHFLSKYGFKSLHNRFGLEEKKEFKKNLISTEFKEIKTLNELEEILESLEKSKYLSITESKAEIAISTENLSYVIVITEKDVNYNLFQKQAQDFTFEQVITTLKKALESEAVLKIFIHSKSFLKKCAEFGVVVNAFDDVAVMAYSVETGKFDYSFSGIYNTYLGEKKEQSSANLLILYKKLSNKMHLSKKHELYECLEKPMIKILTAVENKGIKVDSSKLYNLNSEFEKKARKLEEQIYKESGVEFNIASPKQLGEVLFDKMGIKGGKKSSKTGAYTTNSDTLEQLSDQGYEIADLVMEWRHFTKLINTYTNSLPKNINGKTGRIHTTFEIISTSTGRLSSHSPNLQNIPVRTEEGKKIRGAFVAEKGHSFISADYSQIELRLLAHIANIEELKKAFLMDEDIHKVTASQIFDVDIENVTKELRYRAKGINFGIIYGISAFGLAKNIGISKQEAALYIEEYLKKYPGIKEYMQNTIEFAKLHGFVSTFFGRNCYINDINSKYFAKKSFAERAAINAPLQGSQADIIKKAMIEMPKEIAKNLILQIHDELLFEIPDEEIENAKKTIKKCMEGVVNLDLPIKVDICVSKIW